MANIRDGYSLTELCAKLDLSPSWVKKIEKHLSLKGWGSGQRGKKSYYDAHKYEFFRKISILRFLGFGLEDIKQLFDQEMEISNFVDAHFPEEEATGGLSGVGGVNLYLLTNVILPTEGLMVDIKKYEKFKKQGKAEAKKLDNLRDEYRKVMRVVATKFTDMHKYLTDELKQVKSCQ